MNDMQQQPVAQATPPTPARPESFFGKVLDFGSEWAALGLGFGKLALKQSAHTLENAAGALESLSSKLTKKRPEAK